MFYTAKCTSYLHIRISTMPHTQCLDIVKFKSKLYFCVTCKNSEYDQEIPESQSADKPVAS